MSIVLMVLEFGFRRIMIYLVRKESIYLVIFYLSKTTALKVPTDAKDVLLNLPRVILGGILKIK